MMTPLAPQKFIAAFMALALTAAPAVCCCFEINAESPSTSSTSISNTEMEGHHHHGSQTDLSDESENSTPDCGDCGGSDCLDCATTSAYEQTRHDQFAPSNFFKFEPTAFIEVHLEPFENSVCGVDYTKPLREPPPFSRETLVSLFSLLLV